MKSAFLVLSILLLFFLTACGPKYAINKTYEIANSAWSYADSLRFEFEVADTVTVQNLYSRIHTQFPDGTRLSKPLSLELADKAGIWQGDCNSKSCTIEIPIQEGAYFNQAGKYVITVEQFMRDSVINGVQSVTLKVAEADQKK